MKRLLPTKKDDEELHNNFKILLSRILANHIEIFKFGFSDVVSWHITHKYSQQMSEKSKVVSKFLRLIPVMIFSFNIGTSWNTLNPGTTKRGLIDPMACLIRSAT